MERQTTGFRPAVPVNYDNVSRSPRHWMSPGSEMPITLLQLFELRLSFLPSLPRFTPGCHNSRICPRADRTGTDYSTHSLSRRNRARKTEGNYAQSLRLRLFVASCLKPMQPLVVSVLAYCILIPWHPFLSTPLITHDARKRSQQPIKKLGRHGDMARASVTASASKGPERPQD